MLAADKLQLQSSLKQQATALKEKEFNLHHSNLSKCDGGYLLHCMRRVLVYYYRAPAHSASSRILVFVFLVLSDGWYAGSCISRIGYHYVCGVQSTTKF